MAPSKHEQKRQRQQAIPLGARPIPRVCEGAGASADEDADLAEVFARFQAEEAVKFAPAQAGGDCEQEIWCVQVASMLSSASTNSNPMSIYPAK